MLLPFFQWIEDTWLGSTIAASIWAFPVIEAIHLARSCGRLRRETQLHDMLLRLYRSPAVLMQITGERLRGVREHGQARRRARGRTRAARGQAGQASSGAGASMPLA